MVTTTPGFIIESRPRGESGKVFSIFTRDLGLIMVSAQGIRLEKSKLRFHSQEYSFGEFSFVRGKEYWRLTNANQLRDESRKSQETNWDGRNAIRATGKQKNEKAKNSSELKEIIGRIVLLLRRLLHGEEAHPELFDHIEKSFAFIESSEDLSDIRLKTTESVIVFRILHLLGYIGADKKLNPKITADNLGVQLLDEVGSQRMNINAHINKALKESHL
ncbi:MAG: recombination protein O N-terminal domain-containing protein [Patescibacteria group bacterium]